jgi:hypothetical protein
MDYLGFEDVEDWDNIPDGAFTEITLDEQVQNSLSEIGEVDEDIEESPLLLKFTSSNQ